MSGCSTHSGDRKTSSHQIHPTGIYTVETDTVKQLKMNVMIRERGGLISLLMLIHMLLFGAYPSVLNTEVSSFQGIGIEGFRCIQRCLHFRGLE